VKMNEHEASRLSHLLDLSPLVPWLLEGIGVEAVCITRGEGGASLTTRHGTHAVPGVAIGASAGDQVGAGDAFTAAMVHALVRTRPPDEVLHLANQYAALVAARPGAMPGLSESDLGSITRVDIGDHGSAGGATR